MSMWRRNVRRRNQMQEMRSGAALDTANQKNWLPRALVIRRSAYEGPRGASGYHGARPVRAVYPGEARHLIRPTLVYGPRVRARQDLYFHVVPSMPTSLSMARPDRVAFCVRRKARREVMFALNVAGRRGVGRGKKWFRSQESQYGCQ